MDKDPKQIAIRSVQFGRPQKIRNGSAGGGSKPSTTELTITRDTDALSSKLFELAAHGGSIKEATITLRKAGPEGKAQYFKIQLKDVMISSHHFNSDSDHPTESITLNATKIEFINPPRYDEHVPEAVGYDMKSP